MFRFDLKKILSLCGVMLCYDLESLLLRQCPYRPCIKC